MPKKRFNPARPLADPRISLALNVRFGSIADIHQLGDMGLLDSCHLYAARLP